MSFTDALDSKKFRDKWGKFVQYVCKVITEEFSIKGNVCTGILPTIKALSENIGQGRRMYRWGSFIGTAQRVQILVTNFVDQNFPKNSSATTTSTTMTTTTTITTMATDARLYLPSSLSLSTPPIILSPDVFFRRFIATLSQLLNQSFDSLAFILVISKKNPARAFYWAAFFIWCNVFVDILEILIKLDANFRTSFRLSSEAISSTIIQQQKQQLLRERVDLVLYFIQRFGAGITCIRDLEIDFSRKSVAWAGLISSTVEIFRSK